MARLNWSCPKMMLTGGDIMTVEVDAQRLCPLCNNRLVELFSVNKENNRIKCVSCCYTEYYDVETGEYVKPGF